MEKQENLANVLTERREAGLRQLGSDYVENSLRPVMQRNSSEDDMAIMCRF